MWVKRLRLSNFRGFAELDLDLDRKLTVLVGANGSGKSTVLQALATAGELIARLFIRTGPMPTMDLGARDVRAGCSEAFVVTEFRHGDCDVVIGSVPVLPKSHWVSTFRLGSADDLRRGRQHPFIFLVTTDRRVGTADVRDAIYRPSATEPTEDDGVIAPVPGYARFVEWFREREDVENERRVAARSFDVEDPQLRSVRQAIGALMPGIENPRIQRDPSPAMVVTKNGQLLRLDQLSDGERNLIALAGDLARRMALANPGMDSPRETEGVVLIDEVEQHLHPAWQRRVIPALQTAFPNAQFIVTTHSPQVLSTVPAESVVVLRDFRAYTITHPTAGRDSNALLREVFDVTERPATEIEEIRAIRELIEDDKFDEARARLDELARKLSPSDDEVMGLSMRLHVAEAGE